MALAPIGQSQKTQSNFVEKAGIPPSGGQTKRAPVRKMAKKASSPQSMGARILMYGHWGSGKNYSLVPLLLSGHKIFLISTDAGGDGNMTVRLALNQAGHPELLDNLIILELNNHEELVEFCTKPEAFGLEGFKDIYEFDPDFLVWDGFSNWQQTMLSEWIGHQVEEVAQNSKNDKFVSELRGAGLRFETPDWGVVRNETVRRIDRFCRLNNKHTGRIWHKLVLALEGYRSRPADNGGGFEETKNPMVQGSASQLSGAAFDLVIRTVSKVEKGGSEGSKRSYKYVTEGSQMSAAKRRGLQFPAEMDADFGKVWAEIQKQLGLTGQEKTIPEPMVDEGTY